MSKTAGTDVAMLGIGVDTGDSVTELDALSQKLGAVATKAYETSQGMDSSSKAYVETAVAARVYNKEIARGIDIATAAISEEKRLNQSMTELGFKQVGLTEAGAAYVATLKEQFATLGLTTEGMMRYTAAQIGAGTAAEDVILKIEAMNAAMRNQAKAVAEAGAADRAAANEAARRIEIQQARDVEMDLLRQKENVAYVKFWEEQLAVQDAAQAKSIASQISLNAQRQRAYAENRAAALALLTKQEEDAIAAQEKEKSRLIAFNAFKNRTLAENKASAIAALDAEKAAYDKMWTSLLKEQAEYTSASLKMSDKKAIEEIRWAAMSTKAQIAELEKLAAYKAAGVSKDTIDSTFGSAAQTALPNLTKLQNELNAAQTTGHGTSHKLSEATGILGNALGNTRVRYEGMVLAHEAYMGQTKRMAGSMMVMVEYLISSGAQLGKFALAIAPVVAALGTLFLMFQGVKEQKEMNDALILTGNYAGTTGHALNELAKDATKLGGSIGVAKDAVTSLAQSGRFTADQIGYISEAVVRLEHSTGVSIEKTIKEFESLSVQAGGHTSRAADRISANLLKLNDQYHFLTLATYNQIRAMEREGDQMGASALAMSTYGDAEKKRAQESEDNLGRVERAWRAVKHAISNATNAVMEWGKKETEQSKVLTLKGEKAAAEAAINNWVNTPTLNVRGKTSEEAFKSDLNLQRIVTELAKAEGILAGKLKETAEAGQKAQNEEAALYAARDRGLQQAQMLKKSEGELATQTRRYAQGLADTAKVNPNDPSLKQEAVDEYMAGLRRLYGAREEHVKKVKENSRVEMRGEIEQIKSHFDEQKILYDGAIKEEEKYYTTGKKLADNALKQGISNSKSNSEIHITDAQVYLDHIDAIEKLNATRLKNEVAAIDALLEAKRVEGEEEIAILDKQISKTKDGDGRIANQRKKVLSDFRNFATQMAEAREAMFQKSSDANELAGSNAMTGLTSDLDKQVEAINKQIEAQKLHNATIGLTKEQIELVKAAKELQTASYLENKKDEIIAEMAGQETDSIGYKILLKQYDLISDLIKKRKELAGLRDAAAPLEAENARWKSATSEAKEFATQMTATFGTVGTAIGKMTVALVDYSKKQKEGTVNMKDQVELYGSLAGGAAGFFKQGTMGYEVLTNMEKGYRMVQLALQAQALASSLTSSAASFTGAAPAAIAKAGAQTGWIGAIAMAALMAALGYAGAGGFDSGSAGLSAAEIQKTQNTGTVFGDIEAKSDSIRELIELLKNWDITLKFTQQMARSLQVIENSIAAVANLVFRTNGVASGTVPGLATGVLSKNTGDPIMGMLGIDDSSFTKSLPIIGSLISGLQGLWGKTTQNVIDSGFTAKGTFGQLSQGQGIGQYANVEKTESSWFGLVKETTQNKINGELGPELSKQFGQVFTNIGKAIKSAGEVLGLNGDDLIAALNKVNIDLPLSIKGLKGDELSDAINNWLSTISDITAKEVIPGMEDFQQVGEGYFQTVIRTATGIEQAESALRRLGIQAINYTQILDKQGDVELEIIRQSIMQKEGAVYGTSAGYFTEEERSKKVKTLEYQTVDVAGMGFAQVPVEVETTVTEIVKIWHDGTTTMTGDLTGVGEIMNTFNGTAEEAISLYEGLMQIRGSLKDIGLAGIDLNLSMITAAGGMEALQTGLDAYIEGAFTSAEQQQMLVNNLNAQLFTLGVPNIDSWEQFRAIIEDPSSSPELVAALLALAPAFGEAVSGAEALTEALKESTESYEDAVARYNGATDEQIAANQRARDAAVLASFGIDSLDEALHLTEDQIKALTPEQLNLVTAYINSVPAIQGVTGAVNELAAAATGWVDGGTVIGQATTAFNAWLDNINKGMATLADGDFGLQLSLTVEHLQDQMAGMIEMAQRPENVGTTVGLWATTQANLIWAEMQKVTADLAMYNQFESQYEGKGKALLDLEKWNQAQQALFAGNNDDLIALEVLYQRKRLEIINGNLSEGLSKTAETLRKWLIDIKLNESLSPLTAQQKKTEAETQYVIDRGLAQAGDKDALARITKDAEAYLDAAKAVSGFGGDYSAIWAMIQEDITRLANGIDVVVPPPTFIADASFDSVNNNLGDLKDEVVSLKVTIARLLEQNNELMRRQTTQIVTATSEAGDATATAVSSASLMGTRN